MQPTKELESLAVASVTTGRMLCDGSLGPIQEAVEWLVGHPVWTHELPRYLPVAAAEALRQFPEMPVEMDGTDGGVERTMAEVRGKFGSTVKVSQGSEERTVSPLESIREMVGDKPIVILTTDTEE